MERKSSLPGYIILHFNIITNNPGNHEHCIHLSEYIKSVNYQNSPIE
jgi:hypothetical protein